MSVDASALRAILLEEPEAEQFRTRLAAAPYRLTSPVAVFEVVRALLRVTGLDTQACRGAVARLLDIGEIDLVAIGPAERDAALDALDRYGKGRHPAKLNMGDCFAYACAKTHSAPLLFKGDDFSRTDISIA
jgi:ribonuclease VapC